MADLESTPLLGAGRGRGGGVLAELKTLSSTALPTSLGYMVQNSIQTVSIAVVSASGTDRELSAAAHGFMIAMVTAWTIALGGTTAFDTLASASYTQAKASGAAETKVGVLLQRNVIVLLALYAPCAILWALSGPVLIRLGQPEDVAEEIQNFLRVLAFGAPGYILFESGKKFCLVQGSGAPTNVLILMAPVNLLLNLVFVRWLNFGLLGSPIAVSVTYYSSALLLAVYVKTRARNTLGKAWGGFNREAWRPDGCLAMLKLALPGVLMVGTEWVAFEIVALAAGNLPAPSLAAQSVVMTCDQILNTLPFGLGVAASARIGNLLGDAIASAAVPVSVRRLRLASQSAALLATILGLAIAGLLMLFRRDFGKLFSDEQATIDLVAEVLPLVAAFQVFDGWAAANGGSLRGMGKQHLGAAANLVSYYLVALPFGIYLAFQRAQGLRGLWIGNAFALGLVGAGEWLLVTLTIWDREIVRAEQRADEGNIH